jgi:predicted phosphoribosyltransferase
MSAMLFADRHDAGRRLGQAIIDRMEASREGNLVVVGLPRGGVPVAYEVARALNAPLDVFTVRKIGVPGHDEFAMGAIASGGVRVVNSDVMRGLGIPSSAFEITAERERLELERREKLYRGGRPLASLTGATVIVVDDGVATGASMLAAVTAIRQSGATRVVVATPLVGSTALARLGEVADEVIALETLDELGSVGAGYVDFTQTSDDEVRALLANRSSMVPS